MFADLFKKPIISNNVVIEGWSQSDQDAHDDLELDIISNTEALNHKRQGLELIDNVLAKLRRKLNDGMTLVNYKQIRGVLITNLEPLKHGYWDDAKDNIDAIPTQTGQKEVLRVWLKGIIDDYITNNY